MTFLRMPREQFRRNKKSSTGGKNLHKGEDAQKISEGVSAALTLPYLDKDFANFLQQNPSKKELEEKVIVVMKEARKNMRKVRQYDELMKLSFTLIGLSVFCAHPFVQTSEFVRSQFKRVGIELPEKLEQCIRKRFGDTLQKKFSR